jgi:hypothetical protein
MTRMAIAAAALLAPGLAGAEPPSKQQIFCAELRRIVEVAELGGDFTYLERSRAAAPRLGFRKCFAAAAARPAWYCHQSMAPDHLSLDGLAASTADCLPEAARTPASGDEAIFTLPHARIRITEHGGPRAHVGRIVSYRVERVGAEGE